MKYIALLFAAFLSGNALAGAKFIQMSSLVDQVRSGVILPEIIDGQQGIDVGHDYSILIPEKGAYVVMLAPQSGQLTGCGRYWVAVNGIAVVNSSVQICQSDPNLTGVAVSQSTLPLQKGDKVSFWQSGELGIQATIPEVPNEPAVPSVIITVFKL